jgi:hypothetical protein
LILGLAGALIVAVAVVLVVRAGRGVAVELPVAIDDIVPGEHLDPSRFRLAEVRGLDTSAYVTASEFGRYVGFPLIETVHAGFPVGKAQVAMIDTLRYQDRLTLLLDDPANLVYPLPAAPEQVGNYVYPGDYVDVIFTLGRVSAHEMTYSYQTGIELTGVITSETSPVTPTVTTVAPTPMPHEGEMVTTTLPLPLAKVILADVHVLTVEREEVRAASASYGPSASLGTGIGAESQPAPPVQGDVLRLYLEVSREEAEVLSFALHNGALNLPARAKPAGGASEGYTWDDFVETFFEERLAVGERE